MGILDSVITFSCHSSMAAMCLGTNHCALNFSLGSDQARLPTLETLETLSPKNTILWCLQPKAMKLVLSAGHRSSPIGPHSPIGFISTVTWQ